MVHFKVTTIIEEVIFVDADTSEDAKDIACGSDIPDLVSMMSAPARPTPRRTGLNSSSTTRAS